MQTVYHATNNLISILEQARVVSMAGRNDILFKIYKRNYDSLVDHAIFRERILTVMPEGFKTREGEIVSARAKFCKTSEEKADNYYDNLTVDCEKRIFDTITHGRDYREIMRNLFVWCFNDESDAREYASHNRISHPDISEFKTGVLEFKIPKKRIRPNRFMVPLILKNIPLNPYLKRIIIKREDE
ncbi:MAG: hypothetical protein AABX66_00710, partial [Nanoarchaeota archaeon]